MHKKRATYFILSLIILLSGMLLSIYYRPYAYQQGLQDFGFADMIGSLVAVPAFCFLVWGFRPYSNREKNIQILMTTLIYGILWESVGWIGLYGTADWKDVLAANIGGIFTYVVKMGVEG